MQLYNPVRACRLFAYDDAQRYRIGPNFGLLPVNRPSCPFFNNRQDGPMNFADQMGEINYYPSSFANTVLPHRVLVSGFCVSQHSWSTKSSTCHLAGLKPSFTW